MEEDIALEMAPVLPLFFPVASHYPLVLAILSSLNRAICELIVFGYRLASTKMSSSKRKFTKGDAGSLVTICILRMDHTMDLVSIQRQNSWSEWMSEGNIRLPTRKP